jgi:HAE1 family hydrophobic/amphiphilic exporter-1
VYPQILPTIRIGGQLTKAVYQYTLQDADLAELYQWAPVLFDRLRQLPSLQDVNTDLQITSPQIVVDIDRDKASALGISADQIQTALGAAYGSQQVSTIYTPSNQYWVILEVDPQYQRDPTALGRLFVRATNGRWCRSTRSPADARAGPAGGDPPGAAAVGDDLVQHQAGVSLSDAVAQVEAVQRELRVPATLSATFQAPRRPSRTR